MTPSCLVMLSAPRGAGKTTFCLRLASLAAAAGWKVAGLVSPAVFEAGVKTGILARHLPSGEQHLMASNKPGVPFTLGFGEWFFDSSVLIWGNQVLGTCLPCDLLIVDELGPLEFLRGEGWTAALAALRQPRYRLGLVVIRPELQETAVATLPIRETLGLDPAVPPGISAASWWLERLHEFAA